MRFFSGEAGIRTLGPASWSTVFETAPIDHSGISPQDFEGAKILLFADMAKLIFGQYHKSLRNNTLHISNFSQPLPYLLLLGAPSAPFGPSSALLRPSMHRMR